MENNARYVETCGAGERTGLYYTCVNSFLTPDELAFILNNSQSKVLITSAGEAGCGIGCLAVNVRILRFVWSWTGPVTARAC